MSLSTIKSTLDQRLYDNLATTAIKNENSGVIVENGSAVNQSTLNFFIEPKIIPISQDRELHSSNAPFNTRAFYQVDIYVRKGDGTGDALSMVDTLNGLFREHIEVDVVCRQTSNLSPFEDGEWYVTSWRVACSLWG